MKTTQTTQQAIRELLELQNEIPSDWQYMTLRQILSEFAKCPGFVIYWGCYTEDELNTVFTDFND